MTLWGVGPKTAAALQETLGVRTVADLARLTLAQLQEAFGARHGEHLYNVARGIDDSPVVTEWEPKSISRERTFQVDLRRPETLQRVIRRLAAEVADDLRGEGYRTANVTLKVRLVPFNTLTRSRTLQTATDDPSAIADVAISLLERVEVNRPVRLLGIRAAKLSPAAPPPDELTLSS
jgi:DNA polymerase-4